MDLLKKVVTQMFSLLPAILWCNTCLADPTPDGMIIPTLANIMTDIEKEGQPLNIEDLPPPYKVILQQTLMTPALEKHLGRTAIVKVLSAKLDNTTNSYYRTIVMLMDKNKSRNKASEAEKNNEVISAELGFLVVNLNQLPPKLVDQVLHTRIPFGALLMQNDMKIFVERQKYFTIKCIDTIAPLINCLPHDKLYGRTHTILSKDSREWLARTVEILPNIAKAANIP